MKSISILSTALTLAALALPSLAVPTHRRDSNGTAASSSSSDSDSTGIDVSYDVTKCPGYSLGEIKQASSGYGFTAPLTLNGEPCNAYGIDVKNLTLSVVYEKAHQLHVHVYDTAKQQYQLPLDLIFTRPDSDPETVQGVTEEESDLVFNHSDQAPFEFWITRKDGGDVIFDTRKANIPTYSDPLEGSVASKRNSTAMPAHEMIFENQYLQLSSALPRDASIYGLGEYYAGSFRRDSSNTVQPFYTLDAGDPIDSNMYGYHPVYTEARLSSDNSTVKTHAVYYQNTAGLDVILRDGLIQYRAIGGTLDIRFFSGDESLNNTTDSTMSPNNMTQIDSRDLLKRQEMESNNSTTLNTTASSSKINSVNTAISQYVQFIGLPLLAPEWSFGFHLCRWGYANISETQAVVEAMRAADIPLETMWNDIDYLQEFRDFTTDPSRFPLDQFKNFTDGLTANNQHYIPIIDGAIPAAPVNDSDVYYPGSVGIEQDIFLKNSNGTTYIGQVWPGFTYFVDNQANATQDWFNSVYKNFTEIVGFSGIWFDMIEPSSFCVGSCGSNANLSNTPAYVGATSVAGWPLGYDNTTFGNSGNMTINGTSTYKEGYESKWSRRDLVQVSESVSRNLDKRDDGDVVTFAYQNETQRYLVNPPYAIHNGQHSSEGPLIDNLAKKTVSPEAISQGGVFYDVHNLDGTLATMHTHDALLAARPDERPFIVARSSYPGFGQYGHHWLGDNYSKWLYLQKNIQGLLQFQLFGVPMIGSDTCGFNGNTDEELCNRWMMVGAWSPFFRNHNTQGAISQEPYRWDSVANASRIAINKRLEMLPTLYSILARATQTGAPAIRALWYEFPQHFDQLKGSDSQYLFGPNILVTPVMEPNVTSVKGFFPSQGAPWRNIYDHTTLNTTYDTNSTISAPLSTINVHMRAGSAFLTYQNPKYTTKETRDGQYSMLISLTNEETAQGDAYLDDGVSVKPTSRELTFKVNNGTLSSSSTGEYKVNQTLGSISVLGLKKKPTNVQVMGTASNFTYEDNLQRLNVTGLTGDLNENLNINWT